MKKFILVIALFSTLASWATIPQSITLESGNIRIRLDGRKRWNMNRIEWKNQLMGIDQTGAHYGTTYQPKGSRYFIGSGHDESGKGEDVISLKIVVDNKEIIPQEKLTIKGKKIEVTKLSKITSLEVKSQFVVENDIIWESTQISSKTPVNIQFLYFFMHPWSTRFDKFHAIFSNGSKLDVTFKSDGKFPNRKFVPAASWYDSKSGLGVVTTIKNIQGQKYPMRFLWDRTNYRKDYLCDYARSTFPAGKVVVYEAKTGFFQEKDNRKWITNAEQIMNNFLK